MTGEWRNTQDSLLLVAEAIDSVLSVYSAYSAAYLDTGAVAYRLAQAGLVVTRGYYVPDDAELLHLMHHLSYRLAPSQRENIRWVMCYETLAAIHRKYWDKMVPNPRLTAGVSVAGHDNAEWLPSDLPAGVPIVSRGIQDDGQPPMLFGIPIRIDPAARHPMVEIDPPKLKEDA